MLSLRCAEKLPNRWDSRSLPSTIPRTSRLAWSSLTEAEMFELHMTGGLGMVAGALLVLDLPSPALKVNTTPP
jgi:hypothetical protein